MASTDRDALDVLFRSTDGFKWEKNTSDTAADLAVWSGVEVNDEGRVVELYLYYTNLEGEIPASLGQLVKLESLYLNRNMLSGPIPPEVGNLTALEYVNLSGNQLSGHIPKELGALSNLETLWLNDNKLTGPIPGELGALSKLEMLALDHNRLTGAIPEELGALSKLKKLSLFSNQLTALWDHTRGVQNIGHEAAQRVPAGSIPSELHRLLETLDRAWGIRQGNPWAEPPESIVAKGMASIRGYFEDLYAEPFRAQRSSVKIILVGQEGAGKTSLRQSMKANEATPTGEWKEESTVLADVEPMELEGSSVRVYDCAGQVGYTGLLQMFLTPRSVCVLVCNAEAFGQQRGSETFGQVHEDCRKLEELRVCHWLRSISRRIPDNDVILVATKCDLVGGNAGDIGRRMEHACRTWISSWVRNGMHPVRVKPGVCLTSCFPTAASEHGEDSAGNHCPSRWGCDWRDNEDDSSSPSLLHRLVNKPDGGGLRGAQMVLPRSWDMALTVLEALELGRQQLMGLRREGSRSQMPETRWRELSR
ncbi:unnamed protein product [Ectocarpus sp. 12 AP-2014]